jgi:expansin (peptidoglycan-binding protein)
LDFFPDAFGALEDPDIGVIDVDWEVVDCGINTPIRLRAKEQASKYW